MIESIGVSFKQIKGEQKLTAKSGQLLSDIKIGDILKGSLTKLGNGQIVLVQEDGKSIPVKLHDMTIFNELLTLEVVQKDEGQILLKLLQSGIQADISLQDKIMNELSLPKTDSMRQLIEAFLAKQMSLQREGLLRNYHMSQKFQIPAEVISNLSDKSGTISLQEVKNFYEMKQDNLEQVTTTVADLISEAQDSELVQNVSQRLDTYLTEKDILELVEQSGLQKVFIGEEAPLQEYITDKESRLGNIEENLLIKESAKPRQDNLEDSKITLKLLVETIVNDMTKVKEDLDGRRGISRAIFYNEWEKINKLIKSAISKALTVNIEQLEKSGEVVKNIENGYKVLNEILKELELMRLPQKYEGHLNQIAENVQVLNKFNMQGEYYFFPLKLPQGEGKGELYFFKPKKKSNEEKRHLYVVLVLDLPKLKNIEVHIRQEKEDLLLHFKVKEERILNLVETHLEQLKKLMRNTKFNVDEMAVSLIETKELDNKLAGEILHLSQMDFKV